MRVLTVAVCGIAGLIAASASVHAAPNLVVNGDFEQFVNPSATPSSSYMVKTVNNANNPNGGTLTGWTNDGYSFLFNAGTADTTGAYNSEYNQTFKLYGPGNGVANGLTASSPTGGNFLASDGVYQTGAISQTISGLTVGYAYTLSFNWAAGQQAGYPGDTTDSWGVTFGGQTYSTPTVSLLGGEKPGGGFAPWRQAVFTFVPTSATQTLSFLAAGTPPNGSPPFALLDSVSLTATPEPATWAIMAVGLLGVSLVCRRSRRRLPAAELA